MAGDFHLRTAGTAIMNFSRTEEGAIRRLGGLSIVILLHALLAYYLVTSLAHTTIGIFSLPVETKILEEEKPPPPADNLPPPVPTQVAAPPPPYIPPPEVRIQEPQTANVIAVTTNVAPPVQQFTRTVPPQTPIAIAAPPAAKPVAAPPVPAFADLNSCKPDYPRASLMAEEQGTVRVQFLVGTDSQLLGAKVVKSSGHRNLDKATIDALSRCKFKAGYKDGKPIQSSFLSDYVWKLDE